MSRVTMWVKNAQTRRRRSLRKQNGQAFSKELARGIDLESYRDEVLADKNSFHRAQ